MSSPVENTNYVTEGLGFLTSRFKNLPNLSGRIQAFLESCQELEGVLFDVIQKRWLSVATAANPNGTQSDQLDQLGKLVGQPRMGLTNARYGQVILLRIKANRSQGRAEDVVQMAAGIEYIGKFGVPDPTQPPFTITVPNYVEAYPAAFIVEIWDVITPLIAILLLKATTPLGVWGSFHFTTWPDGNDFEFCDQLDIADTGQGCFNDQVGTTANLAGLLVDGVVL